jgi:NAD(P)-dependent dehydrogenase (short-subunit alcohol dehydrogenase family)
MDLGLDGRKALVTGGERGIGREVCLALAREGVDIAYCDVRLEKGNGSTGDAITALGREVFASEVDVSDEDQVTRFLEAAIAELEHIDIFVSSQDPPPMHSSPCAGAARSHPEQVQRASRLRSLR